MKQKIILFSAAALFTAGAGMHLSGYCPLHHGKANVTAHATAKKDAKANMLANR